MKPPEENYKDVHEWKAHFPSSKVGGSDRGAVLAEILAQVSLEALQGDSLESVLKSIVDSIARRLPVSIASIILLSDDGTHFVQEVWSGLELNLPIELPWPVTIGVAGRCARLGESQLITEVDSDPDYVSGNHDVRSEYLVPIRHRDRLHGVLNLESTLADFFTPDVRMMFDVVALQIAGAVHLACVVHELGIANDKLEKLSMTDGLTGIANRRRFDQQLEQEWLWHAKNRKTLALLLVDVDSFKAMNDARGHVFGDDCLRQLASLCTEVAEAKQALVARYGGEEFVLLLADCELSDALRLGERLRSRVEALAIEHPASPVSDVTTVSIGVSVVRPDTRLAPEILVITADRALYAAKAAGRNRVIALP
jgi:diguanylate cyclase (GGDEF)-like protein